MQHDSEIVVAKGIMYGTMLLWSLHFFQNSIFYNEINFNVYTRLYYNAIRYMGTLFLIITHCYMYDT